MIDITNDVSMWLKHTLVSFLQEYFATDDKYVWQYDALDTDIIIVDKYSTELGVVEKKPTILVTRGGYGWAGMVNGPQAANSIPSAISTLLGAPTGEFTLNRIVTDIVRGSARLDIICKNGMQADEIATKVFYGLKAHWDDLKKAGLRSVQSITVSEEQTVRTSAGIDAQAVSISFGWEAKKTLLREQRLNNCEVIVNGEYLFENINYKVVDNGTKIEFKTPPAEGSTVSINYINAITLEPQNDITLTGVTDGNNTSFSLPQGEGIYSFYVLNTDIIVKNE